MKTIQWPYLLWAALLAPAVYLLIIVRHQFDLESLIYIFVLLPFMTLCLGLALLVRRFVKKRAPSRSLLLAVLAFWGISILLFRSTDTLRPTLRWMLWSKQYRSQLRAQPAPDKGESGYLLDATSPNRLWFSQLGKCNWFNLNGLLDQSVEQLAA
jgi:branched-subunit amino acid ABC-type transport system permease component